MQFVVAVVVVVVFVSAAVVVVVVVVAVVVVVVPVVVVVVVVVVVHILAVVVVVISMVGLIIIIPPTSGRSGQEQNKVKQQCSLVLSWGPPGPGSKLSRRSLHVTRSFLGSSKRQTGPIDRDFGALWGLLGSSEVSSSKSFSFFSWSFLGSILNSKDDPPSLKNLHSSLSIH